MMSDEPHDVVKLLLARMQSHPEEFDLSGGSRWAEWLDQLLPLVTEEELLKLREPLLRCIHEEVMDELCNGEERRRKAEEDRKEYEYERHLAQAMQHTKQQAMQQGIPLGGGGTGARLPVSTSPYQNGLVQGIVGRSPTSIMIDDPMLDIGIGNGGTGATMGTITAAQPEPKLKPYDKIKKALRKLI